jgi:predicted permease
VFAKVTNRILALLERSRLDRELDEEMQLHLEQLVAELRMQGHDAGEARRRALRKFGAVNTLRDEARDARGWRWLEVLMRDAGYGLRTLRKRPAFTLVAIVSLAIGVGANTAIFSIVNAILLRELPYENPEELVDLRLQYPDLLFTSQSYPDYEDVRDGTRDVFSGMIASQPCLCSVEDATGESDVFGEVVNGDYFSVLGVRATLGRLIDESDDRARGSHPVVVLSYAYWWSRFGGDPRVIGTELRVRGRNYTVIGVASADYPGVMRGIIRTSIYVPMAMLNELMPGNLLDARDNHNLFVKGRLAPGVSAARAQAAVTSVGTALSESRPSGWDAAATFIIAPTSETLVSPEMDGAIRSTAWLLMIVASLLLLVVCVNLAGFFMARALDRRRELAMRIALGASRGSLVRQLLTETTLLGLIGGAAGVVLALSLLKVAPALDLGLPIRLNPDVSPDGRVFAFTLGISLLAGTLLGLMPALQSWRPDIAATLKSEAASGGRPHRMRLRNALVVAQITVSAVLLVGTGLFLRSLDRQRDLDPGFGQQAAALLNVEVSATQFSPEEGRLYTQRLRDRFATLPGVDSVGMINTLPLQPGRQWMDLRIDGHDPPPDQEVFHADYAIADPGYFESASIALLQGRAFDTRDVAQGERVALVSSAMARRFWPNGDTVGQILHMVASSPALPENSADLRIIGVVDDVVWESLREPPRDLVYVSYSQFYSPFLSFVARTSTDADQTALAMMSSGKEVDPGFVAREPTTIARYLESQFRVAAVVAIIFALFSMLVLTLATVGLYGVVSYAVATRAREVGIRMALGADASAMRRFLTLGGVRLVALGGGIGLILAILVNRLLSGILYGITSFDVLSFAGAFATLGVTAFIATYLPARRVSEVSAAVALRDN